MEKILEKELKEALHGQVRYDPVSLKAYSVDASIYEIEPLAVVIPKTIEEIKIAIRIAFHHRIPIIARGAATGISGGCIGKGIIIDLSKYLHRILEINEKELYAIVEPGVVQDDLNAALNPFGLQLGPETSTGNRATLGGMLANNAAGAHSLKYGKMVDHVLETDLLLFNGEHLFFSELSLEKWTEKSHLPSLEGNIYRSLEKIRITYQEDIQKHFPKISRRVSGYNLDEILKSYPVNISKLIAGSEGTLGICTKMKVSLVSKPKLKMLAILHFDTLEEAFKAIEPILYFAPYSLEMIDDNILSMGKQSPLVRERLSWLQGSPRAVLVVEFEGNHEEEVQHKINRLQQQRFPAKVSIIHDSRKMNDVWAVRKAGLEILLSKRSYTRAVAFIEDIAVPPEQLTAFMDLFLPLLSKFGAHVGIYGHVGAGCIHIRPYLDLRQQKDQRICRELMLEVSDLLLKFHGAMSGEHGDGLIRSWLNEKMFGNNLIQAFKDLKSAFDPWNLMNPGKIITETNENTFLENLRKSPQKELSTFLDLTKEGGFSLAVDLCNGNGSCRKKTGTMCPSFQATGDEYDTTRARAQALRGMIDGSLRPENFKDIDQVLDLCLECKGCKKECPSQVDMAKMKSEFLYQYHQKKRPSLRSYLFAYLPKINHYAPIIKTLQHFPFQRQLFALFGISSKRELPKIQNERFSEWWKKQKIESRTKKIVLFNDTFNEYYSPHIGKSAVKVLKTLGYEVIVPTLSCCGRTFFSKGFLKEAQKCANTLVHKLIPFVEQNIPIIGLEPSCILTIRDDYPSLLGMNSQKIHQIAKRALTIDEFLHTQQDMKEILCKIPNSIHLHGHCHQKAIVGTKPSMDLLSFVSERVIEIPSGCCGMAGSFGYETEHYEISKKISELVLIPYIQETNVEDILIANGFSCRSQILDFAGREAFHFIELISKLLKD